MKKNSEFTFLVCGCAGIVAAASLAFFTGGKANAASESDFGESGAARSVFKRSAPENDIIFEDGAPIKLITARGIAVLENESQEITEKDMLVKRSDIEKKYPLFIFDINYLPDESYLGIELKASTNNFGMNGGEVSPLMWTCTETELYESGMSPCMAFVNPHASSDPSVDVRGWKRYPETVYDYSSHPPKIAVLLNPDNFSGSDGRWCRNTNEEIVWDYMRTSASDYEKADSGNALWRPCQPVMWFSRIPSWATNGVNNLSGAMGFQ